jgi:hypothetical protein
MKTRGWRRIGIVLSVLAFFPLGLVVWTLPSPAESVYSYSLNSCGLLWRSQTTWADENIHDMDQWQKQDAANEAKYEACMTNARLVYEGTTRHLPVRACSSPPRWIYC